MDTSGESTPVLDDLERVTCHACGKLLFKAQRRALRPGFGLEMRCRCKAWNFLIGTLPSSS